MAPRKTTARKAGGQSAAAAQTPSLTPEERLAKVKALRQRMTESAKANKQDLITESNQRRDSARNLAKLERKRQQAEAMGEKQQALETGEDLERKRAWDYTIEDNERWDKKVARKNRRAEFSFTDYDDIARRKYKKDMDVFKPDHKAYNGQRAAAHDAAALIASSSSNPDAGALLAAQDLYRDANSFVYADHKPSEDAIDRVIGKINLEYAMPFVRAPASMRSCAEVIYSTVCSLNARENRSRERKNETEGDITYINEKVCWLQMWSYVGFETSTSTKSWSATTTPSRRTFATRSSVVPHFSLFRGLCPYRSMFMCNLDWLYAVVVHGDASQFVGELLFLVARRRVSCLHVEPAAPLRLLPLQNRRSSLPHVPLCQLFNTLPLALFLWRTARPVFVRPTSAMSNRPSRASTSHVKSYNEDELELRGRMVGGRGRGGGERMGINEKQGGPLRVAAGAAWGVPVRDAEDDDDDDEDEGDEEDISSVYLQAIRAYESMALKKDQRRAEKALKDARAILTATSNEVDSNVRAAMAKADQMVKQASEAAAKATRESQENPSAQWAIAFSSQHAVAEQVTQEFDTVRDDLKSRDGQLFQEMTEAFAERSSRNKRVFKKFKQAVAAQEHEAIEMANMYEESARAQIRYFKAAAKA